MKHPIIHVSLYILDDFRDGNRIVGVSQTANWDLLYGSPEATYTYDSVSTLRQKQDYPQNFCKIFIRIKDE